MQGRLRNLLDTIQEIKNKIQDLRKFKPTPGRLAYMQNLNIQYNKVTERINTFGARSTLIQANFAYEVLGAKFVGQAWFIDITLEEAEEICRYRFRSLEATEIQNLQISVHHLPVGKFNSQNVGQ